MLFSILFIQIFLERVETDSRLNHIMKYKVFTNTTKEKLN